MPIRRMVCGALAGLAGTATLTLLSAGEERRRGRAPVYDPGLMVGRLAARYLGVELTDRQRQAAGLLMRWPYGALWGLALGAAPSLGSWVLWGTALGGAAFGFELIALPLVGATPRLRQWGRSEIAVDAVNTFTYGLVTSAALSLLERA